MVSLCRLCASLRKIDLLVTIKNNSNEICEKLRKCCQLDIKMFDALPKSVCQECLENLNSSYRFYIKVKDAQDALKALYSSSTHNTEGTDTAQSSLVQTLDVCSENVKRHPSVIKEYKGKRVEENQNIKNMMEMKLETDFVKKSVDNKIDVEDMQSKEFATEELSMRPLTKEDVILQNSEEYIEYMEENDSGNSLDYQGNYAQQELLMYEVDDIEGSAIQNPPYIPNENDVQADKVIKQINNIAPDNEVNLEVEYMAYYDDEEDGIQIFNSEYIDQSFNDNVPSNDSSAPTNQLKLNSWKSYKFLCSICDVKVNNFIDLKSHFAQEHNITQMEKYQYKCYDCQKVIPRYNFFLNHVRSRHHWNLKLKCDACDLSCQNFEELSYHRSNNCANAKIYANIQACNKCFKSFHNFYGLQNHIRFLHDSSIPKVKYKCKQCNKEFQYKSCLKTHEQIHKDSKKYSCKYCERSFYGKAGLEQHLSVHIDEKCYQCHICNKSYKTFSSLDVHYKLHSAEKTFKCQFCDKSFRKKIQKLTHERIHTGEMPYQCPQCNKRFRYASALFAHRKIHTGYKPYSCEYCARSFADSSNRNKHVKRMHLNCESKEKEN